MIQCFLSSETIAATAVRGLANPVFVRVGPGGDVAIAELERPVLLIASHRVLNDPEWARYQARLGAAHTFSDLAPNPEPDRITRAHAANRTIRPRTIVGAGGGSTLDLTKIVAAFADRPAVTLDAVPADLRRTVRLIQIPTTAGSGSEVTRWASYWRAGEKLSFDHDAGWSDLAIVDPALSASMGPRLTMATGLDAFAHAVESVWGRRHAPVADALASEALTRIRANLLVAVSTPTPRARAAMAEAALFAGLALSQCRSAAAHALSYGLTGRFGVEHGLAVGLLCRALLPAVAARAADRVDVVLAALGAADAAQVCDFVDGVVRCAGLKPSLAALGVPREALPGLAAAGLRADRFANQPGIWTAADALAALTRIA